MSSRDRRPDEQRPRGARFNLEGAISGWRKHLAGRRTFGEDDLDELESHVRDHIDSLVSERADVRSAFFEATRSVGDPNEVENEYRKTRWSKARHRRDTLRESLTELGMIGNYAKIGVRNIWRNKAYTGINLGGLSLGIGAFLLILLFVLYEMSYDRHFEHADRIYRVTRQWFNENDQPVMHLARISIPIGPALEKAFPEVERSVRLWQIDGPVSYNDRLFVEQSLFMADSSYFEVFETELLRGDPASVLTRPGSVVITEDVAYRYFGETEPVGRQLSLFGSTEVEVTGVMRATPPNAHFHPELLVSFSTGEPFLSERQRSSWGMFNNFATYILVAEGVKAEDFEAKLPAFLRASYEPENNTRDELRLQPLTDIHLHSNLDAEIEPNGNIAYVYLFSIVAFFVLLIACFNFVNLATARSMYRGREVGMRKVLGARPGQVVRQFLGEAVVLALTATVLAILLCGLALPYFNDFTGRDLHLIAEDTWLIPAILVLTVVVVGLVAGGYPALLLSRFQPVEVLKARMGGRWKSRLRSGLVIAQFGIAAVLITAMSIVFRQVEYVRTKQLGFQKEHLVVLPMNDRIRSDFPAVRDRLLASPQVLAVTASRLIPSSALVDHIGVQAEVEGEMRRASMALNPVDHDFVETYRMDIAAGRDFAEELASDSTEAFLLNEAAARAMGWETPEDAVGSRFILEGNSLRRTGRVIGVVKDFHFESLHERIAPLVLFIMPDRYRSATARIAGADLDKELEFLEEVWSDYQPGLPFNYAFIDQNFGALYAAERQLGTVFALFGGLAIVIACLGLFGLASFVTERRTKEIGIRKALGAPVASIVVTLSKGFLAHVGIALVIALPVTFLIANRWLEGFAYSVGFDPEVYLKSGLVVAVVAFLTVAFESVRTATANPVASLRDE